MARKPSKKSKKKTATKKSASSKLKKKVAKKSVKKTTKKVAKKGAKKRTKKSTAKSKKKVSFLPKGYQIITPYLIVNGAADAIDFYKKVFAAKEVMRMEQPGGKIGHAELKFGDAKIMLADECPEMQAHGPAAHNGSPVSVHVYVKDVDATVEKALSTGAKLLRPVENMFYGDRSGSLEDPFGHKWYVSTHIEDVTLAKMKKRAADLFGKKSAM